MPTRGRRRLTPEELEARTREYCLRYGVTAPPNALPPFPSGLRETPQHRDWMAVYKAHQRLGRRSRGQCERCAAPASDASVFCETHRKGATSRHAAQGAMAGCPICGRPLTRRAPGPAAAVHAGCRRLAEAASAAGPETLERLRSYLWPDRPAAPKPAVRGKKPAR